MDGLGVLLGFIVGGGLIGSFAYEAGKAFTKVPTYHEMLHKIIMIRVEQKLTGCTKMDIEKAIEASADWLINNAKTKAQS